MKMAIDKAASGYRFLGIVVIFLCHLVWMFEINLGIIGEWFRAGLSMVTLLVASSMWNRWEHDTSSSKANLAQGVSLIGFAIIAFNAYFVRGPEWNAVLASLGLALVVGGLVKISRD